MAASGSDYKTITIDDFSGGWNLMDDEVGENESPDCYNVSINQTGAVEKRLGFTKWNTSGQPAAVVKTGYYSQLLDRQIVQAGTSLYLQNGNGSLGSPVHTWTTSARCAIVDFTTYVYAIHPVDGLIRSADGTTWGAVAGGPDGTTLDVWQNKLWAGGDPAAVDTLYWTVPGDGSDWSGDGSGTNAIRAKDSAAIKRVIASPREGLIVYKEESAYRVYDSTGGFYQVLDLNFGAANHQAVTVLGGVVYAMCKHGVFVTDGLTKPIEASGKINRFFKPDVLGFNQTDLWCAGFSDPKVYFSLTTSGGTANNLALEYNTRFGCWTPQSCAVSTYIMYSPSSGEKILGGSPTVNGQLYELYDDIGTDDGASITSRYQTALFKPERIGKCRFRQATLRGRGAFTFYDKLDGNIETDNSWAIDMTTSGVGIWDSSEWDNFVWGPLSIIETERIYSLGVGRDISFEIQQSGSGTSTGGTILDNLTTPVLGYWALYSIKLDYITLGLA